MLGLLRWGQEQGGKPERTRLLGLSVLGIEVVPGGRWERRRLSRAARWLNRQGVHHILVPKDFDRWAILNRYGLSAVEVLPLYRAVADRLVLAELERRGVEAHRACVALRGTWVEEDLARTARLLCPRVRMLLVQTECGGERLARQLYREFGVGTDPCAQVDVAVRFGGRGEAGELVLCGDPELLGWELDAPGSSLPSELQPLPLLTVLWQSGLLDLGQIRVFDNKCS